MSSVKVLVVILFVLSVLSASLIVNSQKDQGLEKIGVNTSINQDNHKVSSAD